MSLDVFFASTIRDTLTGIDRAQSIALTRVAPFTDPQLAAAYRAGCSDTIRCVATSFGVELPAPLPPASVLPSSTLDSRPQGV